jgi:hypothetical protein
VVVRVCEYGYEKGDDGCWFGAKAVGELSASQERCGDEEMKKIALNNSVFDYSSAFY